MVEEQIQLRGITDSRVLQAFLEVPRHEFVPQRLRFEAYRDCPLPIGEGQTISQPYMVASMTLAASIEPGDRVLEIGTGSGYQAAILAELGAEVFTVERLSSLSLAAQEVLRKLDYTRIHFRIANGTLGWESRAPFSAIVVTAGAPSIPSPLVDQLALNGRLVVPIEEGLSQVLYVVVKTDSGIKKNRGERCTFVPLLGEYGWKE
jgi:protein-L-isoaspartate(D-aspartate) O-methyltransferase